MRIVHTAGSLEEIVSGWRAAGERVAFVPTMGALHEGHLSLVAIARRRASRVVASIFVNPSQFAPHEDFDSYPRQLEVDGRMLEDAECDLLFAPDRETVYPEGFGTWIEPRGAALGLESEVRPHFFRGVATVVARLLQLVR
ncbi:MAG: pantoate--beta-alanine ligase, partial [Thermoanaerobaculia bacterium]